MPANEDVDDDGVGGGGGGDGGCVKNEKQELKLYHIDKNTNGFYTNINVYTHTHTHTHQITVVSSIAIAIITSIFHHLI